MEAPDGIQTRPGRRRFEHRPPVPGAAAGGLRHGGGLRRLRRGGAGVPPPGAGGRDLHGSHHARHGRPGGGLGHQVEPPHRHHSGDDVHHQGRRGVRQPGPGARGRRRAAEEVPPQRAVRDAAEARPGHRPAHGRGVVARTVAAAAHQRRRRRGRRGVRPPGAGRLRADADGAHPRGTASQAALGHPVEPAALRPGGRRGDSGSAVAGRPGAAEPPGGARTAPARRAGDRPRTGGDGAHRVRLADDGPARCRAARGREAGRRHPQRARCPVPAQRRPELGPAGRLPGRRSPAGCRAGGGPVGAERSRHDSTGGAAIRRRRGPTPDRPGRSPAAARLLRHGARDRGARPVLPGGRSDGDPGTGAA